MSTSITKKQEEHYCELLLRKTKDVLGGESRLNKDVFQRLIESGVFHDDIKETIVKFFISDQYSDEQVSWSNGYLSGYKKPKSIEMQVSMLQELFPGLGGISEEYLAKIESGEIKLPKVMHVEGLFAVPNWEKNPELFGKTYVLTVQKVLDKLIETRNGKFVVSDKVYFEDDTFCQTERTKDFFKKLSEEQGNPDILIVPAQFGIEHAGKSVRRTRVVFKVKEFGLGIFAIGIMLLTHPERLQHCDDLWINCTGDGHSLSGNELSLHTLYLYFSNKRRVVLSHEWNGYYTIRSGSPSAVLPELKLDLPIGELGP